MTATLTNNERHHLEELERLVDAGEEPKSPSSYVTSQGLYVVWRAAKDSRALLTELDRLTQENAELMVLLEDLGEVIERMNKLSDEQRGKLPRNDPAYLPPLLHTPYSCAECAEDDWHRDDLQFRCMYRGQVTIAHCRVKCAECVRECKRDGIPTTRHGVLKEEFRAVELGRGKVPLCDRHHDEQRAAV